MTWMVTEGDWNLFGTSSHLESFYDAQAESLLQGRIDVPPEAISYEAFVRNGKAYGYFGPAPALLRLPFVILFPQMKGHWSRLSMLLAGVLMLAAFYVLLRNVEACLPSLRDQLLWKILRPILVLAAAIGSPNFYLLAESKVYQESIMWGATLSLVSLVALSSWLIHREWRMLLVGCIAASLAFFSRVSSGAGPMFALLVLDAVLLLPFPRLREFWSAEGSRSWRKATATLSVTLIATTVLWMAINHGKFGVWFASQPVQLNLEYTPERLANIKGELASVANIPLTSFVYLTPWHVQFSRRFPWIFGVNLPRPALAARFPGAHLDYADTVAALPVSVPQWFFAALTGSAIVLSRFGQRLRSLRVSLCGALAGCGLMFCWGFLAQRYLQDMLPWLLLGGVAALAWVVAEAGDSIRKPAIALFCVLTLYAMWANFALGLTQQRWWASTVSLEKQLAIVDLANATEERGFGGLISYLIKWRAYIPASSLASGNVTLDPTIIPKRPYQSALRSTGTPPYTARFAIEIPAAGEYELSIRYASAEPRPVLLLINGQAVGYGCTLATGGAGEEFLKWIFAGRHRLPPGVVTIELASNNAFPRIHALRLLRVD
jgi:hypothetical protein